MAAVKNVLSSIGGVLGPILGVIGKIFALLTGVLEKFSTVVFLLGFFGLLFAFIWFFLRYLDKKRVALPALVFSLFFLIFLSGNILMITHDMKVKAAESAAEETVDARADTSAITGGESVV